MLRLLRVSPLLLLLLFALHLEIVVRDLVDVEGFGLWHLLLATALAICLAALTQFFRKSCWEGAMRLDAARELAWLVMCGRWPTLLIKRAVHVVYIGLLWL